MQTNEKDSYIDNVHDCRRVVADSNRQSDIDQNTEGITSRIYPVSALKYTVLVEPL